MEMEMEMKMIAKVDEKSIIDKQINKTAVL